MGYALDLINFILNNQNDWEKQLKEKPYCLSIQRMEKFGKKLILFKHNQIDSNFSIPLVREARGIILEEDTWEPICVPFFKFGNYGEGYAPEIDWKSANVLEKIDGSLIKVCRVNGNILISTNGTIDAYTVPLTIQVGCPFKTFGDMAEFALNQENPNWKDLILEDHTYMFELVGPWNKVVVQYPEVKIHFLGYRNNSLLKEYLPYENGLSTFYSPPKTYSLSSVEECLKAAEALDSNEEGFVVVDKFFQRVKIKSPVYVSLHHLKGNGVLSYSRALKIVKTKEISEVLIYFPEFKKHLEKVEADFLALLEREEKMWEKFLSLGFETRKEQAMFISKCMKFPGVGFGVLDKKISSIKEGIYQLPEEKLCKVLGYKE